MVKCFLKSLCKSRAISTPCELLTIIIILSIHHGALIYHNLPVTAETTFKF